MNQYDQVLKTYADNGLRTIQDWANSGRDIVTDAKPRTDTLHRGKMVGLFSRDQTRQRTHS
jgi:hypothetical protein